MLCVLKKVNENVLSEDTYYGNLYTWFDGEAIRRTDDITRSQFYDLKDAENYAANGLYEVVKLTDADAEELRTYYERKIEECRKQLENMNEILGKKNE